MKIRQTNLSRNAKRLMAMFLAVILLAFLVAPAEVEAADTAGTVRMNVMLVIDGSGSLANTDGGRLRYEAIDLFLAMLTNSGNHVGAIVFDDATDPFLMYSPLEPLTGKAEKLALSEKIRRAGIRNDTNIGGALLAAVEESEEVSKQNGMQSVIILFSDGRTDVRGKGKMTREEAMQASLNAKESAIEKAQLAGIPVYSICLNADPKNADPDELQEISDRTGGSFVAVGKPQDLTNAFETFYHLIFSNCAQEVKQASFQDDGELSFEIDIPAYGAEEVNIILNTNSIKGKEIIAPSGPLTEAQVDEYSMNGGKQYVVVKLVEPESGRWEVKLRGIPQEAVTINVLYNINSTASLTTANNQTDFSVGDDASFTAMLLENGVPVTDTMVTSEYTAMLTLTKNSTGEELPPVQMTPTSNGQFVYSMRGKEYASYTAKVTLQFSNLILESNPVNVNFGNTPPAAIKNREEVKKTVTPISGKSHTLNLSDYFYDAQDQNLTYEIVSSQLVKDTYDLNPQTGELVVNTAKSKSGEVVVQAFDSQGASAYMTVYYKVTNLTFVISGTLIGGILTGLVVLLITVYAATHKSWRGMFEVETIGGFSGKKTRADFKGKVTLKSLGITDAGLDGAFVATGGNKMEFRSKKLVFVKGGMTNQTKNVPLITGSTKIFADEACTRGIQVTVKPSAGPRGGMGGGLGGRVRRNPNHGMNGLGNGKAGGAVGGNVGGGFGGKTIGGMGGKPTGGMGGKPTGGMGGRATGGMGGRPTGGMGGKPTGGMGGSGGMGGFGGMGGKNSGNPGSNPFRK